MSFITKEELKSAIYAYQITAITEGDDTIVAMAINAAEEQVKSYLRPNNKGEWNDGRMKYDVATVFATQGNSRNALLVEITKDIAVWHIIRLCNVDMIYEQVKERYDRAIDWLKKVNKGDITLDIAVLPPPDANSPDAMPFKMGGRKKFIHE